MIATLQRNIFLLIGGKLLFFSTAFISTSLIARSLGPEEFGDYTIILVYASFLSVFLDLGLQTIATRDASRDPLNIDRILGAFFWVKVIWGSFALLAAVLLFYLSPFSSLIKNGFFIIAISTYISAFSSLPNIIFQSKTKFHFVVIAESLGHLAFLSCVGLIFLAAPPALLFFFIAASLLASLMTLAAGFYYSKRLARISWSVEPDLLKELIKNSFPLAVVLLLSQVHFRGDSVLLSLLMPDRDVGIYGMAYKFFEVLMIFPSIVMTAVFPLFSQYVGDKEKITHLANSVFWVLLLCGLCVSLILAAFAPELIELVGGPNFHDSIFPLRILSIALLFGFINSMFCYIIIARNRQKGMMLVSFAGVLLNLSLNAVFIPIYSYKACALITVLSEFVGMVLTGLIALRILNYDPLVSNTSTKRVDRQI